MDVAERQRQTQRWLLGTAHLDLHDHPRQVEASHPLALHGPRTLAATAVMEVARIDPVQLLRRHQSGDWGDLGQEDWRENDFAVGRVLRIFSAYGKLPDRL
jgi:hypothetical protein